MITKYFCTTNDPYKDIEWVQHEIEGKTITAPKQWSSLAVKIVATKYLVEQETSVQQAINRVATFLAKRGYELGYFNQKDSVTFKNEIIWLCINQYGSFNSPVWFNVGIKDAYEITGQPHNYYYNQDKKKAVRCPDTYTYPQASACFIQSVDDSMDDIMRLAKSEAMLFKHGSGTGSNLSKIRSDKERLSTGGQPSGPLSFMEIFDKVAGVVKSGGRVRRSAVLRALDTDHPDIVEFIQCKVKEEKKAHTLIAAGYDSSFGGEAYNSVLHQNANHSVRASETFMKAVIDDTTFDTTARTTGDIVETLKARTVFDTLCDATLKCGDPGLQFDDTINAWHTCKENGRINASNPCLAKGTKLLTKEGYVKVEELAQQDSVELFDGENYTTGRVWKTGTKNTITLCNICEDIITTTPDHQLLTMEGWCEAKDCLGKEVYIYNHQNNTTEPLEVYWIMSAKIQDVYDFSCPTTHKGVANSFVVHNCSEYMFIDNSACNLASLNLSKFTDSANDVVFNAEKVQKAVERFIIAQDILVDTGSYPERNITENSHNYRPLGLGYCDLGATLMRFGIPYDSERGRTLCKEITSMITANAYLTSAKIAKKLGTFERFEANRGSMLSVIKKHMQLAPHTELWDEVYKEGVAFGFRNSQVTVLAPTGTIGFMMDCSTTGIEPELALIKYKTMVGGETIKLTNGTVKEALSFLGYNEDEIEQITKYIENSGTIEGSVLKDDHLPIFDCAFKTGEKGRSLSWKAHIDMMAAAQPVLSGAISKTVNMPSSATKKDVYDAYIYAWRQGLKAVAIFVDGCKANQPLNTKKESAKPQAVESRRRLPDTRNSITHKFTIGGHDGYLTVGLYEDGTPGELFINISKEGSTISGLLDTIGTLFSIAVQYGVPLGMIVDKFMYMQFEPQGMTRNKDITFAKSIVDYIGKWLKATFIDTEIQPISKQPKVSIEMPIRVCPECGGIATPNGTCYRCEACGYSLGCS